MMIRVALLGTVVLLASCGTKKAITEATRPSVTTTHSASTADTRSLSVQKLSFVEKVADTKVLAKNLVSSIMFNVQSGDKDITVPGSIHMRKDEVIRIQLFIPLLGTEVARLEFTPDYVLVVDRMHKEYVMGDYNQLDFLKQNGINFSSLQSLFWNQLFLPGQQSVSESGLKQFGVNLSSSAETFPVTVSNGNMTFAWNAEKTTGLIRKTNVTYNSQSHGTSTLDWTYDDFTNFSAKLFPAHQTFRFTTTATNKKQEATVDIQMKRLTTDDDWDAKTVVSDRYKKVDAKDVLSKITNL